MRSTRAARMPTNGAVVLLIAFQILLRESLAVDRSNFKTCDQSSFCKRHRSQASEGGVDAISSYHVKADTVKFSYAALEAVLGRRAAGAQNTADFRLKLLALTDGRLRLTIDEIDGLRPRFSPVDALNGPPKEQRFKSHKTVSDGSVLVTGEGNKLVLNYDPFRLDVYASAKAGDVAELLLSLNSRALLKIEEFRKKPEKKEDNESPGDDTTAETPSTEFDEESKEEQENPPEATTVTEEEGMWEEHFKSHHDTKPHGASSIGLDVAFVGYKYIYGLPEHADAFALKSTKNTEPYRLYNLDVFEYELNSPMALYGSVPYVVAHNPQHTVGFLWLNAAETWVDVRSSTADKGILGRVVDRLKTSTEIPQIDTHWISESGLLDAFVLLGPRPNDVFRQYADLTGVTELPPMFGIGYHQCRWNYKDMEDVAMIDAKMDEHDIPMDVIWLDIEHTDGKKYFTWDHIKFSDPKKMIEDVAKKQRKMVTIIDPHIKRDDSYHVYKDAKDKGYFVKDSNGNDYEGHCWPGASMYLDFLNPEVRDYWANQFEFDRYVGSTDNLYTWNDMNEPSVFSGPEITMHKDAKHFGDWEHRDVHNLYGFYHHLSTFNGQKQRVNGRLRPFVLTRAFFVGSQRYSAVWTGDNSAEWGHLQATVPMLLSLSVAGIPLVGADIGGFFRNPDEELMTRWYQAAAFQPFFRSHAHIDTRRREPWVFGEKPMGIMRDAIRRRYQILPYLYTLFYEHSRSGALVMRPMWAEFPEDQDAFDEEKQFFLGPALLIRPVMDPGATSVSVYLPGKESPGPGAVYVETPMEKVPVFVRGGTILPIRERVRRASALMQHDPMTLVVALDYKGEHANGTLYVDDGSTYNYEKGQYIYRQFEFKMDANTGVGAISSRNLNTKGTMKSDVWIEKIVVLGLRYFPRDVHLYLDDYNPSFLKYEHDHEKSSLVIRKPGMNIVQDWRIDIHG